MYTVNNNFKSANYGRRKVIAHITYSIQSLSIFLKVLFLQKQPIPEDITAKHEFGNKLAALGISLRSYEEMFKIENEERFVALRYFVKTITCGFMHL